MLRVDPVHLLEGHDMGQDVCVAARVGQKELAFELLLGWSVLCQDLAGVPPRGWGELRPDRTGYLVDGSPGWDHHEAPSGWALAGSVRPERALPRGWGRQVPQGREEDSRSSASSSFSSALPLPLVPKFAAYLHRKGRPS